MVRESLIKVTIHLIKNTPFINFGDNRKDTNGTIIFDIEFALVILNEYKASLFSSEGERAHLIENLWWPTCNMCGSLICYDSYWWNLHVSSYYGRNSHLRTLTCEAHMLAAVTSKIHNLVVITWKNLFLRILIGRIRMLTVITGESCRLAVITDKIAR